MPNWFKKSQLVTETEQSEHFLDSPNINVRPYEPIIQESVQELQQENPSILNNVTDINVDLGYGQYGSVISSSPNTININMSKLKDEINRQLGRPYSPQDEETKQLLKHLVKQIILHEREHVHDFNPEVGDFPGGEAPAERAQEEWSKANPFIRSLPYAEE